MNRIEKSYNFLLQNPYGPIASIVEHLPTLKSLSSECDSVVEMGIGRIVSTWALLAGRPKKLTSYDINHPRIHGVSLDEITEASLEEKIEFNFIQADTANVEIEPCDLLFIDSLHTYEHLKKELELHAKKVRKYMAFHDTVTFGYIGETGGLGLMKAINEFMDENKDWEIKEIFKNNNGLLVIKRVN